MDTESVLSEHVGEYQDAVQVNKHVDESLKHNWGIGEAERLAQVFRVAQRGVE